MKPNLKFSLAFIALILCALILPIKATAASLVLTTSGVTMSFPDDILRPVPETGTTVSFDFANNSASSVVEIRFEIVDKTGVVIYTQNTPESLLKFGSKARVNSNFYDAQFKKAIEPLTVTLFVAYVDAGAGKTTRRVAQVSSPLKFIERPIAVPTPTVTVTFTPAPVPTPTVTVTSSALVSENSQLRAELNKVKLELKSLNSKMSKICKSKPKPKGC